MYTTLKLTYEDKIATLTLNRAAQRNAINQAMIDELLEALRGGGAIRRAGADRRRRGQGVLRRDGPGGFARAGGADGRGEPSPQPAHCGAVPRAVRVSQDNDCGGTRARPLRRARDWPRCATLRWLRRRRASAIPRCGSDSFRRLLRRSWCGRWREKHARELLLTGRIIGAAGGLSHRAGERDGGRRRAARNGRTGWRKSCWRILRRRCGRPRRCCGALAGEALSRDSGDRDGGQRSDAQTAGFQRGRGELSGEAQGAVERVSGKPGVSQPSSPTVANTGRGVCGI